MGTVRGFSSKLPIEFTTLWVFLGGMNKSAGFERHNLILRYTRKNLRIYLYVGDILDSRSAARLSTAPTHTRVCRLHNYLQDQRYRFFWAGMPSIDNLMK